MYFVYVFYTYDFYDQGEAKKVHASDTMSDLQL